MVSPRWEASKSTAYTNQGAVMHRAAANNWLFVIAVPPLALLASDRSRGRHVNCLPQPVDLWTAARGGRCCRSGLTASLNDDLIALSIIRDRVAELRCPYLPL